MQLAMIGLGRMGGNMVRRLVQGGHEVIVYDRSADAVSAQVVTGGSGAKDLPDVARRLPPRRIIWVMVPAGAPVESTIEELVPHLSRGDIVIDGGNSNFRDSMRRAHALQARGIELVDVGTSGGIWGLTQGYCLMIGASGSAFEHCEPIFRTLAPPDGYAHVGPPGAGHYVKMVHNGIEYGMMAAYAEGLNVIKHANVGKQGRESASAEVTPLRNPEHFQYDFNLPDITELWRRGSVVASWLLDLTAHALAEDPELANVKAEVPDSGEGRWTVLAAIDEGVPATVLTASLYQRFTSRGEDEFACKTLQAMRRKFGGH
jgi:6-phosphogluconate dehydrogenase